MANVQTAQSTVLVVEDEDSMRDALVTLLSSADYRCRGFADGEALLEEPLPDAPCCLLLDQRLPGRTGLQIQEELNARHAAVPILFVSGENDLAHAVRAMRAGAVDFVQKPFDPEHLLERVAQALLESMDRDESRNATKRDAELLSSLTQREREVLALLVDGNPNKDVARKLDISVRTVEAHRMHLMDKLGARTLAEPIRIWMNGQRNPDA